MDSSYTAPSTNRALVSSIHEPPNGDLKAKGISDRTGAFQHRGQLLYASLEWSSYIPCHTNREKGQVGMFSMTQVKLRSSQHHGQLLSQSHNRLERVGFKRIMHALLSVRHKEGKKWTVPSHAVRMYVTWTTACFTHFKLKRPDCGKFPISGSSWQYCPFPAKWGH